VPGGSGEEYLSLGRGPHHDPGDGQTEIDVVGTSRHRYALLGACKWRRVVDTDVLDQLRNHQAALGGHAAAARLIIFGREEFTPALHERSAAEGVHLISAADLFEIK
jgi:hypothetical protein